MPVSSSVMENTREPFGLDLGAVAMGALAVLGLVLTVALGVQALYLRAAERERDRWADRQRPAAVSRRDPTDPQNTRGVRWVDQEAGVVSIPIELAMERVVASGGRP